jgi:hypothetical protein
LDASANRGISFDPSKKLPGPIANVRQNLYRQGWFRLTPVNKQQWYSIASIAFLVDIMDVENTVPIHLDVPRELGQSRVEMRFVRSPIVIISPIFQKTLHLCEWNTVVPAGLPQLIWKTSESKTLLKVLDLDVWYVDSEWGFGHAGRR